MVEWIEGSKQPRTDGGGAGGGKLLPAHDRAQTGKSCLASSQTEGTSLLGDRLKARIFEDQLREPAFEIGLRVKKGGHDYIGPRTIFCHHRPRKRAIQ
jgi:hypothetical protein